MVTELKASWGTDALVVQDGDVVCVSRVSPEMLLSHTDTVVECYARQLDRHPHSVRVALLPLIEEAACGN